MILAGVALLLGQSLPMLAMIITNKWIFTHGFQYPLFVTTSNFLLSALVTAVVSRFRAFFLGVPSADQERLADSQKDKSE